MCSGWLRKSPPEKKLRRYVSEDTGMEIRGWGVWGVRMRIGTGTGMGMGMGAPHPTAAAPAARCWLRAPRPLPSEPPRAAGDSAGRLVLPLAAGLHSRLGTAVLEGYLCP